MCAGRNRQGAALLAKHVHVSNRTAYSQVRIERGRVSESGVTSGSSEVIRDRVQRPCIGAV